MDGSGMCMYVCMCMLKASDGWWWDEWDVCVCERRLVMEEWNVCVSERGTSGREKRTRNASNDDAVVDVTANKIASYMEVILLPASFVVIVPYEEHHR